MTVPGDVLDGNLGVDPVLVQQIDGVHAQSTQRIVGDLFDVFGPAVQPRDVAVGAEGETEFCCDHDLSGERRECFADQFFVVAVSFRGVEECHSTLDRGADHRDHVGFGP